jgi:Alginate export
MRSSSWIRAGLIPLGLCVFSSAFVRAQGAPPPVTVGEVTVSGSLRTRVESWNWFGASPQGDYAFSGSIFRAAAAQSKKRIDWNVEAALPVLFGLPADAIAPGARGALGLGGNYYGANGNHTSAANLFVKQAAIRFKQLGGVAGQSVRIGRFEFVDGAETTPPDATLAALKRDRIAHRLIGNFGFSHVGRSVDGAQYVRDRGVSNLTGLAFRPTCGVFDVDGWCDLRVNVFYGAVTRRAGSQAHAAEWRVFGIGYDDSRRAVLKVDNRPAAARQADTEVIAIATFGGHYLRVDQTKAGKFDLLLWGAAQTGSWGVQRHRAGAVAVEGGWQPDAAWKPWFRGGWDFGSGDGDAADGTHGTFFQVLPTPRVYARLPFYNMMNTSDGFAEAIVRPSTKLTIRSDVHGVRLSDSADLWYQGGGAYQPSTFGYAGRPANGLTGLSTLCDVSADMTVSPRLSIAGYVGRAAGGEVTRAIYADGGTRFGYLEAMIRF